MKQIKLATIGSGTIVQSFLDAVKVTDGISLEAVYSRTQEKGKKLAEIYGVQKIYTDLEALLSDKCVNFIYVASPNNLHYTHVKTALLHGKNVICEKPFCPTKKQVEELISLANEKQLILIDATPTAFFPNLHVIKNLLPQIGKLRLVQSSYCQYSSRYDRLLAGEVTNVFSPDFAGGCLQDINYYNIYLNIALFGEPKTAVYYPNICSTGVDTSGIAMLQYPDFVSECTGAKDTWGNNSVQIQGEKGYLYIEGGANGLTNVHLVTKEAETSYNEQPSPERLLYEVQELTKLVLNEDTKNLQERLQTTACVIGLIEDMRKKAGILFAGEQPCSQNSQP